MYNPTHSGDLPQNSAELLSHKEPLKQFPTAHYFQVHFEFLQEQLQLMLRVQETMRLQINQLEQGLLDKPQIRLTENYLANVETHQPLFTPHSGSKPTKNKVSR